MLPNFAIIGAQKSGTTFVHQSLARHPHVFMPAHEVRFFQSPYYERTSLSAFESLFDGAHAAKGIGIVRPDYLGQPECAERIQALLPDARLVVILRNPVERAVSAYFHQMKYGFIPVAPLEEGMQRLLMGDYAWTHPKAAEILDYGFYHEHLCRYLERIDGDRILAVRFEDLRGEPDATLGRVARFLDLDPALLPPTTREQTRNPGIRSLGRMRFLQLRNRLVYRYDEARTRIEPDWKASIPRRALGRALSIFDEQVLGALLPATPGRPSPALTRQLQDLYEDDVRRLERLLGWDLSGWWKPATPPPVAAETAPAAAPPALWWRPVRAAAHPRIDLG